MKNKTELARFWGAKRVWGVRKRVWGAARKRVWEKTAQLVSPKIKNILFILFGALLFSCATRKVNNITPNNPPPEQRTMSSPAVSSNESSYVQNGELILPDDVKIPAESLLPPHIRIQFCKNKETMKIVLSPDENAGYAQSLICLTDDPKSCLPHQFIDESPYFPVTSSASYNISVRECVPEAHATSEQNCGQVSEVSHAMLNQTPPDLLDDITKANNSLQSILSSCRTLYQVMMGYLAESPLDRETANLVYNFLSYTDTQGCQAMFSQLEFIKLNELLGTLKRVEEATQKKEDDEKSALSKQQKIYLLLGLGSVSGVGLNQAYKQLKKIELAKIEVQINAAEKQLVYAQYLQQAAELDEFEKNLKYVEAKISAAKGDVTARGKMNSQAIEDYEKIVRQELDDTPMPKAVEESLDELKRLSHEITTQPENFRVDSFYEEFKKLSLNIQKEVRNVKPVPWSLWGFLKSDKLSPGSWADDLVDIHNNGLHYNVVKPGEETKVPTAEHAQRQVEAKKLEIDAFKTQNAAKLDIDDATRNIRPPKGWSELPSSVKKPILGVNLGFGEIDPQKVVTHLEGAGGKIAELKAKIPETTSHFNRNFTVASVLLFAVAAQVAYTQLNLVETPESRLFEKLTPLYEESIKSAEQYLMHRKNVEEYCQFSDKR